jgi:NAD(P)-dependent dehydrogenase (short-subunit alcohol dehydrogenase family)
MKHIATGVMAGQTVVVTGSSGGIGKATALRLAQMGATVAVTSRNQGRTVGAAKEIRDATGAQVRAFAADLSSQADVRRLAAELLDTLPRIDVLVNNAGGYWNTRHVTADGLERTFAINHLAPFLLTALLLDRLRASADGRVVTVSSNAQRMGRIDFDDLQGEHGYSGARAYNQSKLANILFTHELARKAQGSTVTANALHPGVVRTSFGADDPGAAQRLFVPLFRPFMRTPDHGAATSVLLASSPALKGVQGKFFSKGSQTRSSKRSYDPAVATQLWEISATLVGQP